MDGILVIDKEKGYTSSDVVAKLRGILHQKKIGHAGTLDPDATGVMIILLGRATRLSEMLLTQNKTYLASLRLGIETDTQDLSGCIIKSSEPETDVEKIRLAVNSFVGEYKQVPPMYSAIKIDGKKLYQYARKGTDVDRPARDVTVYEIDLKEISPPYVSFVTVCSKGTYIRTLCSDIGQRLGCGAALDELRRLKSGSFSIDNAITIQEAEKLNLEGRLSKQVIGIDELLRDYPVYRCSPDQDRALLNGNRIAPLTVFEAIHEYYVMKDSSNVIKGIYKLNREDGMLYPDIMLL